MSTTLAVPPPTPIDERTYESLRELVRGGGVVALTGAGMSTASGIPDYRSPDGERRIQPMMYGDFLASTDNRRRYWARSHAGWRRFAAAEPNESHHAVAALQNAGLITGLVTQNVDGLHHRAGSRDAVELHGNLARVVCLDCGTQTGRDRMQAQLTALNPGLGTAYGPMRPDGDVALDDRVVAEFSLAPCRECDSDRLKPDVVFFGGSVPKALVEQSFALVESCTALLVLGSSLQVMSGLRFVRRAATLGRPVAIVTRGVTRGDDHATIGLDALLGSTLPRLATDLHV